MAKRIGGFRRKTRGKFQKGLRARGKVSVTRFFQDFPEGSKVVLKAEPSYQKGFYDARFHGKVGVVNKRRGRCYEVAINDLGKAKTLIVHPIHLRKAE